MKRRQLRSFQPSAESVYFQNPFTAEDSWKTTEINITSELANLGSLPGSQLSKELDPNGRASLGQGFEPYTVTIERGPERPKSQATHSPTTVQVMTRRQNNAALEANTAAWGYTKCALLFFVSLLITWVCGSSFFCREALDAMQFVAAMRDSSSHCRATGPRHPLAIAPNFLVASWVRFKVPTLMLSP